MVKKIIEAVTGEDYQNSLSRSLRKKHGIYYTPLPVVRYIIDKTIGYLLAAKDTDANRSLKILDPACGSAAFLLEAWRRLRDYYLQNSIENPELIALDNIYGMDIDSQAVENTREILLKEIISASGNEELRKKGLKILKRNIFNCNFLTSDIYKLTGVKSFSVVLGNPPYVPNKKIPLKEKNKYNKTFNFLSGQYDLIIPFIEKGLELLVETGILGYIISNKILSADYGIKIREHLLKKYTVNEVTDISTLKIFDRASVYPVITVITKEDPRSNKIKFFNNQIDSPVAINQSLFKNIDGFIIPTLLDNECTGIFTRLTKIRERLPAAAIKCGIAKSGFGKEIIDAAVYESINDKELYLPIIQSGDIDSYRVSDLSKYIKKDFVNRKQMLDFKEKKLIIPGIAKRLTCAVDLEGCALGRVYYITEKEPALNVYYLYGLDFYYLLALFNSSLLDFYFKMLYWPAHMDGGYLRYNSTYLSKLPVLLPSTKKEKSLAQEISQMARDHTKKDKISLSDIDNKVFELYGMTEIDKKIILKKLKGVK